MKIPEPLFVFINAIVRTLLKSPLHRLMSSSFMLIQYVGRKSGRALSTPVRYMPIDGHIDNGVRVYTATHTQWWRNVAAKPDVSLLIAGETATYDATVIKDDPQRNRELLIEFLTLYPQDAVYQDIRINKDGSLNEDDLHTASQKSVIVEFHKR